MNGNNDPLLDRIVPRLAQVTGVAAVVLGGSRARGTATATSDYDLGLYFERATPIDTDRLLETVRPLVDDPAAAAVTTIGAWGPRIVGGGWLSIGGQKVDLLYREVDAVAAVIDDCHAGRIAMDYQPGHPHGFCSAHWMGEVALCKPLHDPRGILAGLQARTAPFPAPLREALLGKFMWEILFSIENAAIAVPRREQTHIAGCVYRALACAGQVLFALNGRYLINEKGALAEAAGFPKTVPDLIGRVDRIWSAIGRCAFPDAIAELRMIEGELQALAAAR